VEEVLTEFEHTTTAMKNIDTKISRVKDYVKGANDARQQFSRQADEARQLFEHLTISVTTKSDCFLDYFARTLDRFADLFEMLEMTVDDLHVMDAASELQKELSPLLVPAVVLVCIITVSNVIFGFLLASDPVVSESLSFESVYGGKLPGEEAGVNILSIFAIFHVALLATAVIYVALELCRRQRCCKARSSAFALDADSEVCPSEGETQREEREEAVPGFADSEVGTLVSSASSASMHWDSAEKVVGERDPSRPIPSCMKNLDMPSLLRKPISLESKSSLHLSLSIGTDDHGLREGAFSIQENGTFCRHDDLMNQEQIPQDSFVASATCIDPV